MQSFVFYFFFYSTPNDSDTWKWNTKDSIQSKHLAFVSMQWTVFIFSVASTKPEGLADWGDYPA